MRGKIRKFKYLDNNAMIFELAEKHFPFKNVKEIFDERFRKSIKESCILNQMKDIDHRLNSSDPVSNYSAAFNWKENGCDYLTEDLFVDYCIWKETQFDLSEGKYYIDQKEVIDLDHASEIIWIKQIAEGINDALLLEYLSSLYDKYVKIAVVKKSTVKTLTHRESVMVHLIKCHLGKEIRWNKKSAIKAGGHKRYVAFTQLSNPNHKNHRCPTQEEKNRVALQLRDQPEALKVINEIFCKHK